MIRQLHSDFYARLNNISSENSPDAIYWIDRSGSIVHCNKAACENLGYTREELLRMYVYDIDSIVDTPEKYASVMEETVKQQSSTIQTLHRRKDGKTIRVEIKTHLFSFEGEEYGVAYVREIDKRVEHECFEEMKRLKFAIHSSEDGMWEYDIKEGKTFVSKRWLDIIGYKEDESHSSVEAWKALLHPDDVEKALSILYDSIANKVESAHVRYRIRHKDGHWLWIYDRAKILFDPFGEPLIVAGFRTDITKQVEAQNQSEELAAILQNTSIEVSILDAQTLQYLYANNSTLQHLGYTLEELKNIHLHDTNPDITEEQINLFQQYLNTISPNLTNYSLHQRKNGSHYPVQSSIHMMTYQGKAAMIIFDLDISELTNVQNRLNHLATHDPLTGLPNRILFSDRLQMAIRKQSRKEEKIAILFIDLDYFKQINDSMGHSVGDKLLIMVAERIKGLFRESDTIARMGGDEFNVLLDGLKHIDNIIHIVQKLYSAFEEPFTIGTQSLRMTLSIGIAIYPNDGNNAEELLKNADAAMHKAKAEGRNTYQFYTNGMSEKALERVILGSSLYTALKEKQFQVFYQPQIDLSNGKLVGMEALVRWNHPSLGIISPANFIPLCEETGLIQEIDLMVLESVLEQQAVWHAEGKETVVTAVNFSVKTLARPYIVQEVQTLLNRHRCPEKCIAIEITESHIMKNPYKAIEILKALKNLNLEISIDDFGTGYSSLSYLKELPVDKLKIDQSFIHDVLIDENDAAITKTIIALAHNLKLDVIAEGIETEEQKEFLIQNGCPLGQGYLFSHPIPATEIAQLYW